MARTEEHEGKTYSVYKLTDSADHEAFADEVWRQVLLWGHCHTEWVARADEYVGLVEQRNVDGTD